MARALYFAAIALMVWTITAGVVTRCSGWVIESQVQQ